MVELFHEEKGGLGAAPYLTGLLWALERAAWEPTYLTRVTRLLGRLASLDPGGRWANRPARSLRGIFLGWYPQTSASLAQRMAALDDLIECFSDVAWTLLAGVLPQVAGDFAEPHEKPRWREWCRHAADQPTNVEYFEHVRACGERLLRIAEHRDARWPDLIELLPNLLPDQRDQALLLLEEAASAQMAPDAGLAIWRAVGKSIHDHRKFANAHWALPASVVDRLAALYPRFLPSDVSARYVALFASDPRVPESATQDFEEEEALIASARSNAVGEILSGGVDALVTFVEKVEEPYVVGAAAGKVAVPEEIERALIHACITEPSPARALFARGFFQARFTVGGWQWLEGAIATRRGQCSGGRLARVLYGANFEPRAWDIAESLGSDGERAYWHDVRLSLIGDRAVLERAVRKLIDHGRPHAAVELIGIQRDVRSGVLPISVPLTIEALTRAAQVPTEQYMSGLFGHRVAEVLSALDRLPEVPASDVARLEWLYLPLLHGIRREPEALQRALRESPELFATVISLVFRPEAPSNGTDDVRAQASPEELERARRGYELLRGLRIVPGSTDSGIDESALQKWVAGVRARCKESGHLPVADVTIGELLAHAPADPVDGLWPVLAVRRVVEEVGNKHLKNGMVCGILNKRGAFMKRPDEGGRQERALAAEYRSQSDTLAIRWPKTASILRDVAEDYERGARREDIGAELGE